VLSWFGETSVPKTLPDDFAALGVKQVIYLPDADATGHKSAKKVHDLLYNSDIVFSARQLPEQLGKKADTGDLWQAVQFDATAFQQALSSAPEITFAAPQKRHRRDFETFRPDYTNSDYERAVEAVKRISGDRLNATGFNNKGWSKPVLCLFHDDSQPSASWNRDSGVLHCFACGESYSPQQVAEALHIEYPDYPSSYKSRKKKTADKSIATRVNPVKLPDFPATRTVDLPYISDINPDFLSSTSAIRSPLATGKTSLISRQIARIDATSDSSARVLVITHLQNLANNIAERLSRDLDDPIESYRDIPHEYRKSVTRIVVSYDSLHTVRDNWDYVFVDEFEQLQRHLSSGTMTNHEPVRAYRKLTTVLRQAKNVMVLDAHLSATSVNWLKSLRPDVTAIENKYRRQWKKLMMQKHESAVLADAFSAAKGDTKGVVIPTNSRTRSQDYYHLAVEKFGKDAVMLINGDTTNSTDARTFIRTISEGENRPLNELIPGLRVLIASPSLATGIDVQAQVSGVYGVFTRQIWATGYNIMQMMMRYRHAETRQLCIIGGYSTGDSEPVNWKDTYNRHIQRAIETADAANFSARGLDAVPDTQRDILKLQALLEADTATHRRDLFSYVIAVAKDEGFSIRYNDGKNTPTQTTLKAARSSRKELEKQRTLKADAVSPQKFDELIQEGNLSLAALQQARYGKKRWYIEHTAGQTITDELYDMLHTARKRTDFNRLVDMLDSVQRLQERDRHEAQTGMLLMKRQHYTRHRDIIEAGLSAVFGRDWLTSDESLTEAQIADRMSRFLRQHWQTIEIHLDTRRGLSDKPIDVMRRLLRRIGLRLGRKQIMVDGRRFYVYFIAPEHRDLMLKHARHALTTRADALLHSVSDTFSYTERSNEAKPEPKSLFGRSDTIESSI
jgi:hypothetical protein